MAKDLYCKVAVNCPLNDSILFYRQSRDEPRFDRGDLIEVPLGRRKEKGCVLEVDIPLEQIELDFSPEKIKEISGGLTDEIKINQHLLSLFGWMTSYYQYSLGQLIFDTIPKILKRPRKLSPIIGQGASLDFTLTDRQREIVDATTPLLFDGFSQSLIHGVTGSGKTLIYLLLIKMVVERGHSALFLLPEINLTPQFVEIFSRHVDAEIYTYNSSISASEKFILWKKLMADPQPMVVIGVRSSVFLPIPNLGLIVIDEEHDQSFKQEDRCAYNARDVAIKRASMLSIPILLGSATPSLDTYYRFTKANIKGCHYHAIAERAGPAELPTIHFVDMKSAAKKMDGVDIWPFDQESIEKIKQALNKDEQVLVFINRLGFAGHIQCSSCGFTFKCPNCSVNLKYFKKRGSVSCQHCDYHDRLPEICPECQNLKLYQKGFGTERVELLLRDLFVDHVVDRFDRDEIRSFNRLKEQLGRFHRKEIDILVGTQMLSKGHNFQRVNLVIILGIDSQLNFPDFRAGESAYQLLTQVGGRSGRFMKSSEVRVLTLDPDNQIFTHVRQHSFDGFYQQELKIRRLCDCPPFKRVVMIYFTSKFQSKAQNESLQASNVLRQLAQSNFESVEVLGPRPGLIEKRVNKFTWAIMIKSSNIKQLHDILVSLKDNFKHHYSISVKIDVDPYHLN
ncbi:MAG: primosomal protein N' [Bdellovibrionales bacterium]|jgi:primosomal protein N' (replication factor Y) (superfamily II helicase)|nr:primosomal protein N' [Bdellovibrionales bacterium]MBT3526039.1 primosomal protein N' [Bdellovibrionales bacterium]MBT7668699.1 primosomal protein N' [Bdellovibrionales bacterium]MBT7765823.1 primosomal protein N' [Bdellovibrionales bacterium]